MNGVGGASLIPCVRLSFGDSGLQAMYVGSAILSLLDEDGGDIANKGSTSASAGVGAD